MYVQPPVFSITFFFFSLFLFCYFSAFFLFHSEAVQNYVAAVFKASRLCFSAAEMTQTVQTNGVQPLSKTWELSLYELQRTPQEAITDGLEIAVSPRSLHSELMCPICLDMLKNTMTTKECLHRFCADCIITALRSG